MACKTLVKWRPVPDGSILKAESTGDQNDYIVVMPWSRKGVDQTAFRHEDLNPGPAEITFEGQDRIGLNPVIVLFRDVDTPVTLKIWIEDAAGNVISVMSPQGPSAPQVPAECEWSVSTKSDTPLPLTIVAGV
jgi:hypothetical protein